MSAHLEVIEADILGVLDQLPFPLPQLRRNAKWWCSTGRKSDFKKKDLIVVAEERLPVERYLPSHIKSGYTKIN